MRGRVDEQGAASFLLERDNILIFCHRKPDGDAVGSGFALLRALEALGKTARVECVDPLIVGKYREILGPYEPKAFAPACFVAVDIADPSLLKGVHEPYGGRIDLCIDHHKSNSFYAERTLLDGDAGSAAELVYKVLVAMGAPPSPAIADAVFIGVTSDTGCFRQGNTTAQSHEVAAEMIRWGADTTQINRLFFGTKSKGRLNVERMLLQTLEYGLDDRYAAIFLPADVYTAYDIAEEDLDGIAAFPRTIEGVLVGATIRDNGDGSFRVSLRTYDPVDASSICAAFGGGGHRNAAGCTMTGSLDDVKERLLAACSREMTEQRP